MNKVMLTNVAVVKKTFAHNEGKKAFMNLRIVSTEGKDNKTFLTVYAYDKLAEIIDKYVFPGSRINIEAKLKVAPRTTKSGDKIEEIQIVANNVEFISTPRKKDGTTEGDTTSPDEVGAASAVEEPVEEATDVPAASTGGFGMFAPDDDDVPF